MMIMINFRTFEGKAVKLVDKSGNVFEGFVGDYIFPDDNEPKGIESIILDYPIRNGKIKEQGLIEIYTQDIKSIEIIEKK